MSPTSTSFIKKAFSRWWNSDPANMGASLAFYALFAIAPLFIIMIILVSTFMNPMVIEYRVLGQVTKVAGSGVSSVIRNFLEHTEQSGSISATIIGIITVIIGSLGVFNQLQRSLDRLWRVPPNEAHPYFKGKLLSFLMAIIIGTLIILALGASTMTSVIISILGTRFSRLLPLIDLSGSVISSLLLILGVVFVYRYLPSVPVSWSAAWIGSAITGALFIVGKIFLSLYFAFIFSFSSYGAAGTVIAILLWVYYSAQVFYLGASFTYVLDTEARTKHV